MSVIIQTNNLCKKYNNNLVVNNVNMTINKGDIYGFIGENGAGKSTVIKLITNVVLPTSGNYKVNLEDRLGVIGAVIESSSLHLSLTAFDNLMFQSELFNLNKNNNEIVELLNLVGLNEVVNNKKKVKDFSLGMKQRLSLAMALITNPEFIILDEPMNGLDPRGIKKIRELIIKLNKEKGITFLISSHVLMELDKVVNKYGFISKGKLLKEITINELNMELKTFGEKESNIENYYFNIIGDEYE